MNGKMKNKTRITWEERNWSRPTWVTPKYGNLLADTIQGEVCIDGNDTFSGWFFNWSDSRRNEFRLGFATRGLAPSWVNTKLRAAGV